ncbi:MAG: membrane protein insertase YidC [Bacteroidetes bacterium CHB5]|nr:membrane protein insertase YidC [Bacteroidetes bacterium CHB5]
MDRNSAIGLTLIAVLLLVYFNFLAPQPQKPEATAPAPVTTPQPKDSLLVTNEPKLDSATLTQYGSLASFMNGTEAETSIENADLRLKISNKGRLNDVELKNFKTYYQKPLYLAQKNNNTFSLLSSYQGKEIDLYSLYYTTGKQTRADTTLLTFTASVGPDAYIKHVYAIPPTGYVIGYELITKGVELTGKELTFKWNDKIPVQEKAIADSRAKTNMNWYLANGDFDYTSQASTDLESEQLTSPVKWISIRQKFFISAIIADQAFSSAEVKISANPLDSTVVKDASMQANIPIEYALSGKAKFSYYFGPNDYEVLPGVTEGFRENLDLGWPPMSWINRYAIIPIFKFLEGFIGNYGIIIVLLVLFVKLILLPLSYKSYLGMAKMRLLKPELDIIKEKNGDNMTQAQQDQMKLYQQAGVNPFSGCIPLLLQMPILFAMFYFFPVSIELRQKPFLWAEDLSTYDSIINLPFTIPFYGSHVSLFVLLMTASTIIYTWQNNQLTSVQGPMKTMGYIMPVIFMFVLNSFSAGLSFYYFVSNLVTFAQQAIIKRFVDEDKIKTVMDEHKKKYLAGESTGKKSSFMNKLEQAMKASEEARKASKRK